MDICQIHTYGLCKLKTQLTFANSHFGNSGKNDQDNKN